jgi:hypothetical protein
MAVGVLNKTFTEGLENLAPGLIFVASIALPATTTDTAAGREIGSATGDPIPMPVMSKLRTHCSSVLPTSATWLWIAT